jgi:ribose 5-phosphate isomerase B
MIAIGCDHTSVKLKNVIIHHLKIKGIEIKDYGTYSEERTDYPIYGEKVARAVADGVCEKGIVICGSGVGIGIAANKIQGVRCVICSEAYSAVMSRKHNDTNVLAFGSRVVGEEVAEMIVDAWLETEYQAGRHQKRVEMIGELDRLKSEI